jgi:hypothetical protein
MRTTVTLDADTEHLLRGVMRERGVPFKQAVNDAIRAGLAAGPRTGGRRFSQKSFRLGAEQYFRWDKALSAAEAIEDEELARKLSLRK